MEIGLMNFLELLNSFDLQTTIFLIGIAVLTQASLIALQSVLVKEYHGVRTAALGNLGLAIGLVLVALRNVLPDLISIILANYLQVIGVALLYVAVCRFTAEKYSRFLIAVSVLPVFLLFPYYTFVDNNLFVRIVLIDFGEALLLVAMALALRRVRRSAYYITSNLLMFIFGLYAILLTARSIGAVQHPPESLFALNWGQVFYAVTFFVASYLWSSVFSLMVSQRLQNDLNELATMDSLTRVINRRGMTRLLEAEFARKTRTNSDFSILLIDVDRFKLINDEHGHHTGDHVLHALAQKLSSSLRAQDFVARWGGEEFVALLPATSSKDALEIAERLRTEVEKESFLSENKRPITISIGIGNSTLCDDMDKLYKAADAALYKAKRTRNAVAWNDFGVAAEAA